MITMWASVRRFCVVFQIGFAGVYFWTACYSAFEFFCVMLWIHVQSQQVIPVNSVVTKITWKVFLPFWGGCLGPLNICVHRRFLNMRVHIWFWFQWQKCFSWRFRKVSLFLDNLSLSWSWRHFNCIGEENLPTLSNPPRFPGQAMWPSLWNLQGSQRAEVLLQGRGSQEEVQGEILSLLEEGLLGEDGPWGKEGWQGGDWHSLRWSCGRSRLGHLLPPGSHLWTCCHLELSLRRMFSTQRNSSLQGSPRTSYRQQSISLNEMKGLHNIRVVNPTPLIGISSVKHENQYGEFVKLRCGKI